MKTESEPKKTLRNFSEYHALKAKHLSLMRAAHDQYVKTGDKKYWEEMLDQQWLVGAIDELEPEFFERKMSERKSLKQDLLEQLHQVTRYLEVCEIRLSGAKVLGYDWGFPGGVEICAAWYEACIDGCQQRLRDINRKLKRLVSTVVDNDVDIKKARDFPVEELLKFSHAGFARCPWHNEKTGSLKWYKENNTVYCFGCHKYGDAIDIYQALNSVSFREAVRRLSTG